MEELKLEVADKNSEIATYKTKVSNLECIIEDLRTNVHELRNRVERCETALDRQTPNIQEIGGNQDNQNQLQTAVSQIFSRLEENHNKFNEAGRYFRQLEQCVKDIEAEQKKQKEATKRFNDKITNISLPISSVHQWVISIGSFIHSIRFSDPFYLAATPLCFQLSVKWENDQLRLTLYRRRGKNDTPRGSPMNICLANVVCNVYVFGADGLMYQMKITPTLNFPSTSDRVELSTSCTVLESKPWSPKWLINGQLHVFCDIAVTDR